MIAAQVKSEYNNPLDEINRQGHLSTYAKSILVESGSLFQSRDSLRLLIFVNESSVLELFEARDSIKGSINLPSRMAS